MAILGVTLQVAKQATRAMDISTKVAAGILYCCAAAVVGLIVGVQAPREVATKAAPVFTHPPKQKVESTIDPSAQGRPAHPVSPVLPKFIGYLTTGGEKLFALSLAQFEGAGKRIEWVRVGQKIGSLEILKFDTAEEVLLLKDAGGESFELNIVDGHVGESEEQLRRRMRDLIDTSLRKIRDIHPVFESPRR